MACAAFCPSAAERYTNQLAWKRSFILSCREKAASSVKTAHAAALALGLLLRSVAERNHEDWFIRSKP